VAGKTVIHARAVKVNQQGLLRRELASESASK